MEYLFAFQPIKYQPEIRTELIKGEIRIAAVQLELVFDYHIFRSKAAPALYSAWDKEKTTTRKETIISIINYLYEYEKPHVICFPELTVPPTIIGDLKQLAQRYKTIIIAGTNYTQDRRNSCPVIVPDLDPIPLSEKFNPSPWEDAPNELDRMKRGEKILIMKSSLGKKGIIMICKDFLDFERIVNDTTKYDLAFVICPMCSPKLDDFYDRARILMRMGIYTVLCNTIGGIAGTTTRFLGGTAFFGSVHERYLNEEEKEDKERRLDHLNEEEGIIVASLDLEHTFSSTSPTDPSRTTYCNYRDPKIIPLIREAIEWPLRIGKINVDTLADLKHFLEEEEIKWHKSIPYDIAKWTESQLHSPSLAKKIKKCNNLNDLKKVIKETISVKQE